MNRKVKVILIAAILITLAVLIGSWVSGRIYAAKHEKIDLTPWDVVEIFQDEGYEFHSIQAYEHHEIGGRFGETDQFIALELDDMTVLVFSYSMSWEDARQAVIIANRLDKLWNGGNGFSFHYGPVVVTVPSSNKEFGLELLSVLEEKD
ncbi:MAG: hypothetical protein ABFS17_14735 [Chloroflexota bacterium]